MTIDNQKSLYYFLESQLREGDLRLFPN